MALNAQPKVAIEFDSGVWTDVSADCREASSRRGRSYELDSFSAGTAQVTLNNRGRKYDPEYSAGTYYGKLLPRKRIRIGFTYSGTTYWKFYGYIDGWPQSYDQNDATVILTATDGFKVLAGAHVPSVWQQTVPDDTPVVWYRLGESNGTTAADSSGNKVHGTYEGGATYNSRTSLVFGDSDNAIGFDGTDDKVTLAVGPIATTAFTVEAWVSRATLSSSDPNGGTIYEQGERGAATTLSIYIEDDGSADAGKVTLRAPDGAGGTTSDWSTVRIDDGDAHHVVVRRTGAGVLSTWIDGVDHTGGFAAAATTSITTTYGAAIGASTTPGFDEFLNGTVDEVAIYGSALTDAAVIAHHAAGATPWDGDTAKARIDRVLDYVGWPAADRDLDTGSASLPSANLEIDALSHLQAVELTEGGRLFIDRTGRVTLIGRQNLWSEAVYNTSNATFGDSGTELKYHMKAGQLFDFDDAKIVNEARVRQFDGSEQVSTDATSGTAYGLTSRSESTLDTRPGIAQDRAEYLVYKYAQPVLRMPTVEIKPERSASTLYALLGANDLGYRYTFKRRPQGIGSAISREFHVESEQLVMTPDDITVSWELSPAEPQFWIWDTSTWETGTNVARWGY